MSHKKIKIFFLITFLLFTGLISAQKVTKTGTTAAKFLSIGIGPKANAMGGAFTSLSDDASAIYWNPAGIVFSNQYQVIFSYSSLFADLKLNFFGFIIPAGNLGSFAASVTALSYGDLLVTTEDKPEGTGETFSPGSYAFGLSYAKSITEDFIVGATVKLVTENIYHSSATGVAFDIGTIFKTPFSGIRFASSITNFGTKMQMTGNDLLIRYDVDPQREGSNETVDANIATDKFDLPLKLQIGISRDFIFLENQKFTLSIDGIVPNDNDQSVNVGGNLVLFDGILSLRGGYKSLFLDDSQEGLTLGVGLRYKRAGFIDFGIDYSYQEFDFLGNVHSFGVILRF